MRWMIDERDTTYRTATTSEHYVLLILADFVKEGPGGARERPTPTDARGWTCFPGQELLIKRSGMPKRTLQHNLAGLRRKGFLATQQRGAKSSNLYTLLDPLADQRTERSLRARAASLLIVAPASEVSDAGMITMVDEARAQGIAVLDVVRDRLAWTEVPEAELASFAELAEHVWRARGPEAGIVDAEVVEGEAA